MAAEYGKGIKVKSGIMVGLGETDSEVLQTLNDLFKQGVRSAHNWSIFGSHTRTCAYQTICIASRI